jgi:hypothetical protein
MLNLNFNTLYSKLAEQERGYNQPTVSASFFLYGAGGPGAFATTGDNQNFRGGGGGGAGMVVSGSINITPDSEYTFIIPNTSSRTDTKGEDSFFYGYDNDTQFPISVRAGGGFRPTRETYLGGNSGNGVYNHPNFTASYSSYTGGLGTSSGGTEYGYGGGAGSAQNGGNATVGGGPGPVTSGNGGNGVTSSITLWGWEGTLIQPLAPPFDTGITNLQIGSAGGGGGDKDQRDLGTPSIAGISGSVGGGDPEPGVIPEYINGLTPGAGGAGDTIAGITPITTTNESGVGGTGALIITYAGIPKLQFTGNVVTEYDAVNNATAHLVSYGTGSFIRSSGGPFDNNPNP